MSFILSEKSEIKLSVADAAKPESRIERLAFDLQALQVAAIAHAKWFIVAPNALDRFVKGNALDSFLSSVDETDVEGSAESTVERRFLSCSVSPEIAREFEAEIERLKLGTAPLIFRTFDTHLSDAKLPLLETGKIERLLALRKAWAQALRPVRSWPRSIALLVQELRAVSVSGVVETFANSTIDIYRNVAGSERVRYDRAQDKFLASLKTASGALSEMQAREIIASILKFEHQADSGPRRFEWAVTVGNPGALVFTGVESFHMQSDSDSDSKAG